MKIPLEHYIAGETLYTKMVSPVCEKYNLTYMEFTILMFLANNPQYHTASQIVQQRRLTKSHVSMSVRTLQERGLLRGEYQDGNRRSIYLFLTDETASIVRDGRQAQEAFNTALFIGFTPEEEALLSQYMDRIDTNIERTLLNIHKEQERNHD